MARQCVLALAAHKGVVDFDDILHDRRDDPGIRALSERIEVIGDTELDRTYPDLYRSIVEVETTDGRHRRDISYPKGSPQRPLSRDELHRKFARLTEDVISARRRGAITEMVRRLEEVPDIGDLARLLRRDG